MIDLDAKEWGKIKGSCGGSGRMAATLLQQLLENPKMEDWAEFHHQVCHQGTVGEAAYLAAPHMVAIARKSDTHFKSLLLFTLGSIVASRRHHPAALLKEEWKEEFEHACKEALSLATTELANPSLGAEESWAMIMAVSAFHGHTSLALLMEGGFSLSCPECGESIHPIEA